MAHEINPDEINQVLAYINQIKEYDYKTLRKYNKLTAIVWGLVIFMGGIMDFIFQSIDQPELSGIPWALGSAIAMIFSFYVYSGNPKDISTQEVKDISQNMRKTYRNVLLITIIGWFLMFIFVFLYEMYFLIMPLVALIIGGTYFISMINGKVPFEINMLFNINHPQFIIPSMCLLSFVINLSGYYIGELVNFKFITIIGLITGLIIGTGFLLSTRDVKQSC